MIELGLSRITKLLSAAGPRTWKAIHIAGTNGKGSTAAFLLPVLNERAIFPGRFTSPHLIDRWDCVTLGLAPVSKDIFHDAEQAVQERDRQLETGTTEFELLTATAFEVFERGKIDIGIVECGMGGRLDATNALTADDVLVSIITKIGLDHQGFLGATVEQIAHEKAGIMKRRVPVIVDGSNDRTVLEVLERHAAKVGAPYEAVTPNLANLEWTGLPLHQKQNLSLAIRAYGILAATQKLGQEQGDDSLTMDTLISALTHFKTAWPGRLQTLSLFPITGSHNPVLLDGAHNVQSASVLRTYVDQHLLPLPTTPVTYLLAMTEGKDTVSLIKTLIKAGDHVVACKFGPVDGMPWIQAEDPEAILDAVRQNAPGGKAELAENGGDPSLGAIRVTQLAAETSSDIESPVVIAGSLYLVSDILRVLRTKQGNGVDRSKSARREQGTTETEQPR